MDQLHLCVATSSVQHLFAQAPISFTFFCPKLAAKHGLRQSNGVVRDRATSNSLRSGDKSNDMTYRGGGQKKIEATKENVTSIVVLVIESQDLSSTPLGGIFGFLQG